MLLPSIIQTNNIRAVKIFVNFIETAIRVSLSIQLYLAFVRVHLPYPLPYNNRCMYTYINTCRERERDL